MVVLLSYIIVVYTNNSSYLYNYVNKHDNSAINGLNMDISTIINSTPDAILKGIARRVKSQRLERNLTQRAFARRAGIGYDAYRRFENTGEITLHNLVLCAIALDDIEGFMELFSKRSYQSIDDLLKTEKVKQRKSGSRNE